MKQQEGEGFSSKKDFESLLLLFLFYLNDMCFRLKSCCHFLKLRNHFLYALLSYGCALTTNNSPVLQLCVTICCASLSLVCILNFTHLGANFTEKRICMHFLCSKFPRIRKKQLGGRKETKIWARFSTPSPPPVNRAKEKHLSWKMWRERRSWASPANFTYLPPQNQQLRRLGHGCVLTTKQSTAVCTYPVVWLWARGELACCWYHFCLSFLSGVSCESYSGCSPWTSTNRCV